MYTYKRTKIHTSNSPKKKLAHKKFASQTSNSTLKKKILTSTSSHNKKFVS